MSKPTDSIPARNNKKECVFCERIKNKEYDDSFANHVIFEPLNPVVKGHKLVVPTLHTANMNSSQLEAGQTGWALRYFTNDLDEYNLITSKGKSATQTIQHLHFHIVPRTENDGFALPWDINQEIQTVLNRLKDEVGRREDISHAVTKGCCDWCKVQLFIEAEEKRLG